MNTITTNTTEPREWLRQSDTALGSSSNPNTMKQHFLFGGQAVATYQREGVNGLKDVPFGLYKWEDGKSSPLDLLDAYCGWESFAKITEDEFEQLFMQAWC